MNQNQGKFIIPFNILKKCIQIISDLCVLFAIAYLIFFIQMLIGYKMLIMKENNRDIEKGTLIYYQKVDPIFLTNNNLIVYKEGNSYKISSIHKVIAPEDSSSDYSFLINLEDGQVEKKDYSEIIGKVAGIKISYIGFYIDYMNNHKMLFYTLIGIIIVDIVVGNIISSMKEKKKRILVR